MNLMHWLGAMIGLRDVQSIDRIEPSFAAPWAHAQPLWVLLGCLVLTLIATYFYARFQPPRGAWSRRLLTCFRAGTLALLLLFLAEPTLVLHLTSQPRPLLWLLMDGTESMSIVDDLGEAERLRIAEVLAERNVPVAPRSPQSRLDDVKQVLTRQRDNLLARLDERFRLRAYQFDRPDAVRIVPLQSESGERLDPAQIVESLSAQGQVTSLGGALADLEQRHAASHLAGVVLFSDFDQNAGPPAMAAARRLGVPLYCVGVGPTASVDLSVDLQADLLMKKAERSSLTATVRQSGLDGERAQVRLSMRRLGEGDSLPKVIEERSVNLSSSTLPVDFSYTPDETGRFVFIAEVEGLDNEMVKDNNRAEREVNVRDDFLRLLYVEHEPTWEWRFIKEVFHRDQLVGTRGFRTFLRSADPKVRQTNELFLPTLTPPRSDFFANDVLFLGDMPPGTVSPRFAERVKEFVSTFGGGLVVIAGPHFGPGGLASTHLADMLPVVVDADARIRDERDFVPRLTARSEQYDFMRLGSDEREHREAWENLGRLPWYQPVARVHPQATVLLEHPSETCVDGKSPQPLIAIRRYGRGEVVYLAFNETWRLRRRFGEKYYRQFWGQMIHRLGLSHALGTQKRFVVRTDRQQYRVDDRIHVTVEAYDENFEPLTEEKLTERKLLGEVFHPGSLPGSVAASTANPLPQDDRTGVDPLPLPLLRPGVFEAHFDAVAGGEYRIRVADPVARSPVDVTVQVTDLSVERRSAVRNVALQEQLAAATGGRSYDLVDVDRLVDDIQVVKQTATSIEVFPLWNTWLGFCLVLGLLFCEWLLRKGVNLP